VRGASRVYDSGASAMVALDRVSIDVPAGRFVSVIGPSGCGKSTLLRLVAGLEAPDSGEVAIFGASPAAAAAAKMIGLVPQAPALLPWRTVRDNVIVPGRVNRGAHTRRAALVGAHARRTDVDVDALLAAVGLADAAHKYPSQLSGGMQQRVAIARAFALQPEVLLLDEPFSALDEFTRESLQEQLLDLWDEMKTTVLFVTHSVSEAVRLSDCVVVMAPRPGRIVDVVDIPLPRPRPARQMQTPQFHALEDALRERLQSAWRQNAAAA